MSVQNKTVIYPLCSIYKGDVLSNTSRISYSREIVIGKVGDDIIYQKHGKGVFTKKGDFYYIGQFKNDRKHGKGVITYQNNSRYSGDWINDRPYGRGEITWPDGTEYKGEVTEDDQGNPTMELAVAHGKGSLLYPCGTSQVGVFSNNRQISGKKWYSITNDAFNGTFTNDIDNFHKKGQLNIFNYYVYDGNFTNNMFDGKGIITYKNGDKYSGIFNKGFFNGTGIFYDAVNKREYRGNWKNGNMLINHNIRHLDLGRRGKSFTKLKKINLNELRKEADKKPSSSILRPAPNTLFPRGGYVMDYTYNIQNKIEEFEKLKITNPREYKNKPVAYYTIKVHGGYSHGETKKFIERQYKEVEFQIDDHRQEVAADSEKIDIEYLKELEEELELLKKRYHKLKGDNPYEGEQDTFIVPEGIRLVFLSKSLTTISVDTDQFLFKPEFYTNSLTDRASYESISPITLFSTIKNNPTGSVSKIDICKFLNNKTLPSKFTTNYMNWRIDNRTQIRQNSELFHYNRNHPFDEIGTSLKSCSNSIYDSGMECNNLELTWSPTVGSKDKDKRRVKIGIYPLPSDSLTKEAQNPKPLVKGMEKAFENFKRYKSFKGGFMPSEPSITNDDYLPFIKDIVEYTSDAEEMWDIYGDKTSQLKDFVQQLPRGTREHPCVYFMNTCRSVMKDSSSSNIDRDLGVSLRTHSDTVQGAYDTV